MTTPIRIDYQPRLNRFRQLRDFTVTTPKEDYIVTCYFVYEARAAVKKYLGLKTLHNISAVTPSRDSDDYKRRLQQQAARKTVQPKT